MVVYAEKVQHLQRHSTQKMYNTYGVDLHTTCITQGRLTPTLGYKTYNAFSVELIWNYKRWHLTPLCAIVLYFSKLWLQYKRYHFASQFASFYLVFCIISSHDLRQITTATHANNEMMHFTLWNRGKWIAPLPSTNQINNTRIIHLILNLIAPLPSMIRINNRGEGEEQYKWFNSRNGMK